MPQQFDDYLAALREKAEGTYSWWAWLKEVVILVGSVCSIFVCYGMILFIGYGGIAEKPKEMSYQDYTGSDPESICLRHSSIPGLMLLTA